MNALPTYDPKDPLEEEPACVPNVIANGQPQAIGSPLVGQSVTISARSLKLFDIGEFCTGYHAAFGPGELQWEFLLPADSAGIVEGDDSKPQIAGSYTTKNRCNSSVLHEIIGAISHANIQAHER